MVLVCSLLSLVVAGISISWMKLDHDKLAFQGLPVPAVVVTVLVFSILTVMVRRLLALNAMLHIPMHFMVEGDLTIDQNAERVDLVAEEQDRIEAAR